MARARDRMRQSMFPLLMAAAAGVVLLMAPVARAAGGDAAAPVCKECHEEVAAAFKGTFHGRVWAGTGASSGCESCHGSADKHKANPSPDTIVSFGEKSKKTAQERNAPCLGCHEKSSNLALWDMGKHAENDVACASCHTIHQGKNVVAQPDACMGCHKNVRVQINKQSHHPIIEGKVKCSDCHAVHGATTHGMLVADNINQLCYKCHADKRGPFVWEHAPVEENCCTCHNPHGSQHGKLMVAKIPNLCQDCHDWSNHPGTPYEATNRFNGTSPSNRFFARSCLNCHNMIHGSNMPVNPGGTNTYGQGKAFTR